MSADRETLREAVARAIAKVIAADDCDYHGMADAVLSTVGKACAEVAMPPDINDTATPDHMAEMRYRAGRTDAANAILALTGARPDV